MKALHWREALKTLGLLGGAALAAGCTPVKILMPLRMMATRVPDLDRWESPRDYPTIENGLPAHESPTWTEASAVGRLAIQPPAVAPSPRLVTT